MDIDKIGEISNDTITPIKYNIDWKNFLASGKIKASSNVNPSIITKTDLIDNGSVKKVNGENIKSEAKFFPDDNDMNVPGLTSFQFSNPAIKDTLNAVNNFSVTICDEEVPL